MDKAMREHRKPWIDLERPHENWMDTGESDAEVYERLFGESCKVYSAEQIAKGHPERAMTSAEYMKKCADDPRSYGIYDELTFTYGRKETTSRLKDGNEWTDANGNAIEVMGKDDVDEREARNALHDYVFGYDDEESGEHVPGFIDRNPNLKPVQIDYHADEDGAPHVHFVCVPVAGYDKGMRLRKSFTQALIQQGFEQSTTVRDGKERTPGRYETIDRKTGGKTVKRRSASARFGDWVNDETEQMQTAGDRYWDVNWVRPYKGKQARSLSKETFQRNQQVAKDSDDLIEGTRKLVARKKNDIYEHEKRSKQRMASREQELAKREKVIEAKENSVDMLNASIKLHQIMRDDQERKYKEAKARRAQAEQDVQNVRYEAKTMHDEAESMYNEAKAYREQVARDAKTIRNDADRYANDTRNKADRYSKRVQSGAHDYVRKLADERFGEVSDQLYDKQQQLNTEREQLDKERQEWETQREQRRIEMDNMKPPYTDLRFMRASLKAFRKMVEGVNNPDYKKADTLAQQIGELLGKMLVASVVEKNNELFSKALSASLEEQTRKDATTRRARTQNLLAQDSALEQSASQRRYDLPDMGY